MKKDSLLKSLKVPFYHYIASILLCTFIILLISVAGSGEISRILEVTGGSALFAMPIGLGIFATRMFEKNIKNVILKEITVFIVWLLFSNIIGITLFLTSSNNPSEWAALGAFLIVFVTTITFVINYLARLIYTYIQ